MQPVAPVSIVLRPSRQRLLSLALAHVAALLGVLLAQFPVWLSASMLLLIGASFASFVLYRRVAEPVGLVLYADGRLAIVGPGETAFELDNTSTLLGPLVVLRYRKDGRMCSLALFPDSFVDANDLRRFRRWFGYQARPDALSGPG